MTTKTLNKNPIPFDQLKKAPGTAFEFSGRLEQPETEDETTFSDVSILARSPDPINHWWWGQIVHDMAGFFTHKPSVVLDWNHDPNEIVGLAEEQEASDEGLKLRGRLVSLEPKDQADKIMKWRKAKVPLEASIYFDEAELEYIPEDVKTEVNGKQFSGPGVIVRKWTIRGCAICPYGYDGKTETLLSKQQFNFSIKEMSVSAETKTEETPPVETKTEETPKVETKTVETVDAEKLAKDVREQLKAERNKFTAAFGDVDGSGYFAQDLSFTDAQTKHIAKLSASLKEVGDENAKLKEDLAQFRKSLGEASGLETPPKNGEKKFARNMTEAREMQAKK